VTVVGLDDTDSRDRGMCTTYAAALVADRLREGGADVGRPTLVRLNPAVPYKTRGNAALAVPSDAGPERALSVAREVVGGEAMTGDDRTNPGVVVAPGDPDEVSDAVAAFSKRAVREHLEIDEARDLCERAGYLTASWGDERGLVGALAAVGARAAWDGGLEPTYEAIAYRERGRWGRERDVDDRSVFAAADDYYPAVWDTVDRVERETVCVPHTPGPVLYGIRGDDPAACEACADRIDSEPVERRVTFVTNQGTDAHLRDGTVGDAQDGRAYRLDGTVGEPPETRRGGHVFFELAEVVDGPDGRGRRDRGRDGDDDADGDGGTGVQSSVPVIQCAAFEPTGRFRDRVRALRVGDRVTACGEVSDGTIKLEKFAVRDLVRTERITPECPDCERRMESAGRDQGYRCRDCGTTAAARVASEVARDLEPGWYEVPPHARRHVATPLVRGGFDAPTHPER
jgi:tRNA(Ile2)-agmatinylcytidine synthase